MNKLASKIHDSELEVMRVLWGAGAGLQLSVIRQILSGKCGWEDSTVKTLLRRLQAKGAIKLERRGVYSALLSEAEYNEWSTQAFINRIYNGSAKKLIASLVSDGKLNETDIAELSAMFRGDGRNE